MTMKEETLAEEGKPESEFEEGEDKWVLRHAIFMEPLGNVPRPPLVTVPVTGSIADAIRAMNDQHLGCALVVRLGKLVGILTERDLLRKVMGTALDITKTSVE